MSDDEIFDPEIHAVDRQGNPSTNKDGSLRKKRRDAGAARSRSGGTRSRSTTKAAAADDQKSRYTKAWMDTLGVPVMVASFIDPVDGWCASELAPVWADALGSLAVDNPRMAALTEKLAVTGAVGAVAAVGLLTFVQFAHNHGKIPEQMARTLGARPRSEVEKILEQRGAMLRRQAPAPEESPAPAAEAPTQRFPTPMDVMAHA